MKILLLSIWPEHANRIFDGTKTAELRRVRPKVKAGDTVLIYVTAPVMALGGRFEVADVVSGKPNALWRKVGRESGLTKTAFDRYYEGAKEGHAILVRKPHCYLKPIPIGRLQKIIPGFVAPQGYRYLSADELNPCMLML